MLFRSALLCVIKTAAAGFLSGLVYKLFMKFSKFKAANVVVSAAVCPVVNTGIFALGMLAIFGKPLMENPDFSALSGGSLVALVFVFLIGVNFFVELALNVVVCPVISKALFIMKRSEHKQ